jgi:hypothetical protein
VPREILIWAGLTAICAIWPSKAQVSGIELGGHIVDENGAPVAAARLAVRPAPPLTGGPWQTQTDPDGAFSLALPAPGNYLIDIRREGYYELKDRPVDVERPVELTLTINSVREVFQSVDVNAQPSPADIAESRNEEHLSGTDVNDIPYPNSHSLRNAMKLMPGVVEDTSGALHFNGSSENQVEYVLNGFNITDPVSGQFHSTLAVEGVRSVDYASGRYSPEYDKGTAGVLAISTETGTDALHYTATDFIPGIQIQQGVRLGNWYPRAGISGPIVRGRAWFSDTLDFGYNTALITGLPSGENTRNGWAVSNLLHTQFNTNSRNILYTDFLVNVDHENRVGLGPLDPVSTTQTVHGREYFGSIRDQFSPGGGTLLEFGYAHNAFANSQTPQGQNPYVFSPEGRSGNYFVKADWTASRDEGMIHGYAPQFTFAGAHQVEAGMDADRLRYDGNFHRTGYELEGLSGQVLSRTSFVGSGVAGVRDTEVGPWALDRWRVSKRLEIDAGIRWDWDQLVGDGAWSPRISFSWAPFAAAHTRVAGGYSLTHDAVPLEPFGRVSDQTALTTAYDANGAAAGLPAPSTFVPGSGLQLPRAGNWSLSIDHEVSAHVTASVTYLRRRGTEAFNFFNTLAPDAPPSLLPLPSGASAGVYQLANLRRDDFDSVQITVHQALAGQHEWMASYTRSRAQTNALLDANTSVPLAVLASMVPMPWDSPNRVLAWAYLPLPMKNWSIAALVDARSGFPFSVQEETGVISGGVNSYRYPLNFDLDIALERMVTFHGYRFALRGGANNVTNARNPTAVNNTIGSPAFLQFLGLEGRHFVVRIRFFGRAGSK